MTLAEFRATLPGKTPPLTGSVELEALWWAAKGDWNRAHGLVNDAPGEGAAWVHAYLHRVEGDLKNAGYWYGKAGRPKASGSHDAEWERIAAALLDRS